MQLLTTKGWDEYALIDSGFGRRLERFADVILDRPDPQALWNQHQKENIWKSAHAQFIDKNWHTRNAMPNSWHMHWKKLTFALRLTPFKHTGVFPEQHLQWEWLQTLLQRKPNARILNLFAYTGITSLVCAAAGTQSAQVTHVDGSRPSISWAKENQKLSGLQNATIRWILDDALSFVSREVRRDQLFDGIIMDPPVYGHGPQGEVWDFSKSFPLLLRECRKLLAPKPLFVMINAYAISSSALMLHNVMADLFGDLIKTQEDGELILEEKQSGRPLSTGIYSRISF